MPKILIVEDESMLLDLMSDYMRSQNYDVTGVKSYNEALSIAYETNFDLWIFDVKIIGGNGFNLLRELRDAGRGAPCIFTTSLNTVADVAAGFESGCDDYLKKPFELRELHLRAQNLLRRSFTRAKNGFLPLLGELKFDLTQNVLYEGERAITMSKKQGALLALLLKNRDRFVSHDEIFSQIWDYGESPSELSLRVYIAELRKILGKERIISKSKLGYKYV